MFSVKFIDGLVGAIIGELAFTIGDKWGAKAGDLRSIFKSLAKRGSETDDIFGELFNLQLLSDIVRLNSGLNGETLPISGLNAVILPTSGLNAVK